MSKNLNQDLYSRFGLSIDINKVQQGCKRHFMPIIIDTLSPLTCPGAYEDVEGLIKIQQIVFRGVCRQLFLDQARYSYDFLESSSYLEQLLKMEFSPNLKQSFEEYLVKLQLLLNVVWQHNEMHEEMSQMAMEIDRYFTDFPILGLMIKSYKKKAPQIFPTTSEKFTQDIKNTLGLLEIDKKYEHALLQFENGMKEFFGAKTQAQYKDVIEDMYCACDELVKVILNNKNKGFRHISDKSIALTLGLNGHQKELYKNLRNWIDEIKHGTLKQYDKNDTEIIISLVASFIRYVIMHQGEE